MMFAHEGWPSVLCPASAGLFYIDADALYALKSRGFGGEVELEASAETHLMIR